MKNQEQPELRIVEVKQEKTNDEKIKELLDKANVVLQKVKDRKIKKLAG